MGRNQYGLQNPLLVYWQTDTTRDINKVEEKLILFNSLHRIPGEFHMFDQFPSQDRTLMAFAQQAKELEKEHILRSSVLHPASLLRRRVLDLPPS
jgi:hypothetical protein